jgi:hypothetical protein
VSGVIAIRIAAAQVGDHGNIFRSLNFVQSRSTTLLPSDVRAIARQAFDMPRVFSLPRRPDLPTLSRCGAIRAKAGTRPWLDREEQQPKSFAWWPTRRPEPRPRLSHRSPIRASSAWCGYSPGKLRGTLSKLKQTAGSVTASRSKEAS